MGRGTGVRAASKSSIEVSFEYRGVRCREKLRLPPSAANIKFGVNLKARIEHEIATGAFDYAKHFPRSSRARIFAQNPAQTITVGELLTDWLRDVRAELQPETYGDYAEYIAKTWRPLLGTARLSDLTPDTIYEWIGGHTASKKRILNLLTPLRQALRYAVHPRKLLASDPLAKIAVRRPAKIKTSPIDPFTPAEVAAVLAKLEPELANMCQFWVWAGLRPGELIDLKWSDIDFDRGVASIVRAARGSRRKAPKTAAGVREIKLLPPALEALHRQKPYTRLLHGEIFQDPGTRPRGNDKAKHRPVSPWTNDKQIRVRWKAACEAAGVRYRFPRQLRHTYASWMLSSREDPLWISKQMGHADVSVTLKVYAKYIPAMNPDAGMRAFHALMSTNVGHE
ncbi:MAG: Arm DNA-binding domain-containing protein [Steroidobacteraceae bacterium]